MLGLDTNMAVDVATKNATLNGKTCCSYYAGDAETCYLLLGDTAVMLDQFINLFLLLVICHRKAFHCEVGQQYWHDLVHIYEI